MTDSVIEEIRQIAKRRAVDKLVLFGSRARRDNTFASDYDFAVWSDENPAEQAAFYDEVDEIETLKKIDLIFVDLTIPPELLKNIESEGVIIYERKREVE